MTWYYHHHVLPQYPKKVFTPILQGTLTPSNRIPWYFHVKHDALTMIYTQFLNDYQLMDHC